MIVSPALAAQSFEAVALVRIELALLGWVALAWPLARVRRTRLRAAASLLVFTIPLVVGAAWTAPTIAAWPADPGSATPPFLPLAVPAEVALVATALGGVTLLVIAARCSGPRPFP